ncbi:nucleoid occlusion factor SlmA [Noviherbaspirillum agri]
MNTTPAKHLPAEERRAVTIEAVVELAATQNPSEISTGAIAKRMNLTQGALFRHFPSKDAIWQAVMEWVADGLLSRMERAAAGIDSPLAAMQAMFMSHVEFVVEYPGVPRMMFGELQRSEPTPAKRMAQTLMAKYAERIRERIEQGKQAGEIAEDVDTQAAAVLFLGTIQGLVMQSMLSGDIERIRSHAPGVFAIYLRGIRSQS